MADSNTRVKQLATLRADIIEILRRHDTEASFTGREADIAQEILVCMARCFDIAGDETAGDEDHPYHISSTTGDLAERRS